MRNLVGGVRKPPYEKCIFNCDKLLQWRVHYFFPINNNLPLC